mgnify:CR=1 FL=1
MSLASVASMSGIDTLAWQCVEFNYVFIALMAALRPVYMFIKTFRSFTYWHECGCSGVCSYMTKDKFLSAYPRETATSGIPAGAATHCSFQLGILGEVRQFSVVARFLSLGLVPEHSFGIPFFPRLRPFLTARHVLEESHQRARVYNNEDQIPKCALKFRDEWP